MTWEQMSQFERDCWAVEKVLGHSLWREQDGVLWYKTGPNNVLRVHRLGASGVGWSVTRWECDGQVMKAAVEKFGVHAYVGHLSRILVQRHGSERIQPPHHGDLPLAWIQHYQPDDYTHAAYLAENGGSE